MTSLFQRLSADGYQRRNTLIGVCCLLFLSVYVSISKPSASKSLVSVPMDVEVKEAETNVTVQMNISYVPTGSPTIPPKPTAKLKPIVTKSPAMIAYVSQGPASQYPILKERFEHLLPKGTWAFFYHSYDEDCEGCLFQSNTSFAEGKNLAIHAAVTSQIWKNQQVKYLASFDDDIQLARRPFKKADKLNGTGWEPLHNILLQQKTQHPLLKPRHNSADIEDTITYQSCTDENFWIFRRDHIDIFYPHSTYAQEHFHLNALKDFFLMERCYPAGMMVLPHYMVFNKKHRYSVKQGIYRDQGFVHTKILDMLRMEYPTLGPWEWRDLSQRCNVQRKLPQETVEPECKAVMEARFQKWIAGELTP